MRGNGKPKVLRSVYLDVDKVDKLKRLSEYTRIPQAVLIREGIDLMLEKHKGIKKIPTRRAGRRK